MSDNVVRREIGEQPQLIARLLELERANVRALADEVRGRDLQLVVIAARGTSDHAGLYLRYLIETLAELPVSLAAPSVFTLYRARPRLKQALVLGISQSGASEDVRAVLEEGRRQGAIIAAITNEPDSPLAHLADWVLDCHAGREQAIPATKTYTTELALAAMLAADLAGSAELGRALDSLPDDLNGVVACEPALAAAAAEHRAIQRCLVIGRGYNYATASEIALKLKEMAYISAQPYAVPDFLHGPLVVVEPGYPVLLVAPQDRTLADLVRVATVVREHGGTLIALGEGDALATLAETLVRLPAGRHEALSPLTYAVAGQLFAYHLALANGLDPSAPRGLRKVTSTR